MFSASRKTVQNSSYYREDLARIFLQIFLTCLNKPFPETSAAKCKGKTKLHLHLNEDCRFFNFFPVDEFQFRSSKYNRTIIRIYIVAYPSLYKYSSAKVKPLVDRDILVQECMENGACKKCIPKLDLFFRESGPHRLIPVTPDIWLSQTWSSGRGNKSFIFDTTFNDLMNIFLLWYSNKFSPYFTLKRILTCEDIFQILVY